jgi:hypothetical protein
LTIALAAVATKWELEKIAELDQLDAGPLGKRGTAAGKLRSRWNRNRQGRCPKTKADHQYPGFTYHCGARENAHKT